jgi:restriction endonuclease Mrr
MQTFEGKNCRIQYNDDLSEKVIIHANGKIVTVDGDDMLGFMSEYTLRPKTRREASLNKIYKDVMEMK